MVGLGVRWNRRDGPPPPGRGRWRGVAESLNGTPGVPGWEPPHAPGLRPGAFLHREVGYLQLLQAIVLVKPDPRRLHSVDLAVQRTTFHAVPCEVRLLTDLHPAQPKVGERRRLRRPVLRGEEFADVRFPCGLPVAGKALPFSTQVPPSYLAQMSEDGPDCGDGVTQDRLLQVFGEERHLVP